MKKMFSIVVLIFICICSFIQPTSILANENKAPVSIEPRADIIEWRYKIINGKLYKRQFNHSTGKWIGKWVLR